MKKDKHIYSTYLLCAFALIIIIAVFGFAIDTDDMDILCDSNNALIKRINGVWGCSETHFLELNIEQDTPVIISAQSVYYNVTGMTLGHSVGMATDNNSYIKITKNGYYKAQVTTSFSGGANTEYEMEIFINENANKHCELHRKMGTGGDVGSAGLHCIDYYQENDIITLRVADNTNPSQNILIHSMTFTMQEIQ